MPLYVLSTKETNIININLETDKLQSVRGKVCLYVERIWHKKLACDPNSNTDEGECDHAEIGLTDASLMFCFQDANLVSSALCLATQQWTYKKKERG
jgi:hypothetical protein